MTSARWLAVTAVLTLATACGGEPSASSQPVGRQQSGPVTLGGLK
jgi:hypothetical protein